VFDPHPLAGNIHDDLGKLVDGIPPGKTILSVGF
jgi:hypothetical protein